MQRDPVDQVMAAYVDWRLAAVRVRETYAAWTSSRRPCTAGAFGEYLAALDCEEEAATVYAGSLEVAEVTVR